MNTYRYLDLTVGNLSNLALVGTILLAILDLESGSLTIADFVLVSSFSASFFPRLMHVVMVFRNGAKRFSDLKTYFEVLDEKVLVKDSATPVKLISLRGEVEFNKITFAYHEKNSVFSDFSLQIKPGESVALVGVSGSGKTTLIKLFPKIH